MRKKHTKNRKSGSKITSRGNTTELDQVANHLYELARRKLRDGCLDGILCGYEADIRQESTLLALEWYVRSHPQNSKSNGGATEWNAPKNLAMSMRFTRLRFIERLTKQPRGSRAVSEADLGVVKHPADALEHEWPEHRVRVVVREGISRALMGGQISHSNAIVARMVICKGDAVTEVAKLRGVHRSAIYQHLARVRKAISPHLEEIEIPLRW